MSGGHHTCPLCEQACSGAHPVNIGIGSREWTTWVCDDCYSKLTQNWVFSIHGRQQR